METKRQRQLINRAVGYSGSFMPLERAISIARQQKLNFNDQNIINNIRIKDRISRCSELTNK